MFALDLLHQPLLGLFAPEDMAAPLDRPSTQPKLEDMVEKAIELLSSKVESDPKSKGFFLFYESEITDSLQHSNDIIGTYSGALEISDTAILVEKWYNKLKQKGHDTLFFSTSDHETGGFAIGSDVEDPPNEVSTGWERELTCNCLGIRTAPEFLQLTYEPSFFCSALVIANASHSATYTADLIAEAAGSGNASLADVRQIVSSNLKIQNYTQAEVRSSAICLFALIISLISLLFVSFIQAELVVQAGNSTDEILPLLTASVDIRARVGWTTGGHTAADVNIYCYENPYCLKFRGSRDNTELTGIMADFLGDLDIEKVTAQLKGFNATAPTLPGEPVEE